jgi:hypothetical protein
MSDDGEIQVVIESEDASDTDSSISRIAELNAQADRDQARAARLNRETSQLRRESALRQIDNNMLTLQSETAAAESAYRAAREMGDVDEEVAATKRLTAAESRRTAMEMQRGAVERMPVTSGNAFEDHVSRFTEPTAQWMRQHREWVEDPKKNAKMVGAHHMAIGDGLEPDTPEYFAHVEGQLGLRGGGKGSGNRGSNNMQRGSPDGGNAVRLTKGEVERANDGSICWGRHDLAAGRIKDASLIGRPIGNVEYARRRIEMGKQGYYDRI